MIRPLNTDLIIPYIILSCCFGSLSRVLPRQTFVIISWVLPETFNRTNLDTLSINLIHSRSIPPLKIRFDERQNGWVIMMDRVVQKSTGQMELVLPHQEMVFLPAWNEVESQ